MVINPECRVDVLDPASPSSAPCIQLCRKALGFGWVTQGLWASGSHPFWSCILTLHQNDFVHSQGAVGRERDVWGSKAGKKIKKNPKNLKKNYKAEFCGEEK